LVALDEGVSTLTTHTTTAPLSEGDRDRLATMYERHVEIHYGGEPRCRRCNVLWPCDAALLLAELRARRDPLLPDVPLAGFSDAQVMAALPEVLRELVEHWSRVTAGAVITPYTIVELGTRREAILTLARHDLTAVYQLGLARAAVEEAQRHEREANEQLDEAKRELSAAILDATHLESNAAYRAQLAAAKERAERFGAIVEEVANNFADVGLPAEDHELAQSVADVLDTIEKLRAEREALCEAARVLVRELNGQLDVFEHEFREFGGSSNYHALCIKRDALSALLAPTAEPQS
jgi:hypothetical protein